LEAGYFRTLYDYLYWARDRVLAAASGMTEAEYAKPNGFTYGSVRGILTHALSGEHIWLARCRGEAGAPIGPASLLKEEDLPTVEALSERWREEEAKQRAFLAGLMDADLVEDVVFRRPDGNEFRAPLWQVLTLVYSHTLQHRSEAAEALTMVGRSPGGLDLLIYLRESAGR
jgi:uncharacterized damage-inducible protein DinB